MTVVGNPRVLCLRESVWVADRSVGVPVSEGTWPSQSGGATAVAAVEVPEGESGHLF